MENKKLACNSLVVSIYTFVLASVSYYLGTRFFANGEAEYYNFIFYAMFSIVLGIYVFFESEDNIVNKRKFYLLLMSIFVTFMLIMFLGKAVIFVPVWLFGPLVVALCNDKNTGLILGLLSILTAIKVYGVLSPVWILIGILFLCACYGSSLLKNIFAALYSSVFVACAILVFIILMEWIAPGNVLSIPFVPIILIFIGMVFSLFGFNMLCVSWFDSGNFSKYGKDIKNFLESVAKNSNESEDRIDQMGNRMFEKGSSFPEGLGDFDILLGKEPETVVQNVSVSEIISNEEISEDLISLDTFFDNKPDFEYFCNEESDLLLRLKMINPALYAEILYISNIAETIAIRIGANSVLAKAGGLYYKIGKIEKGNYIKNGIKIAEENYFPPALESIIANHDYRYGKVDSPETMIISLLDNICKLLKYLEGSDKTKEFIISKGLFTCMNMKIFDDSGISMHQYGIIRDYLLEEWKPEDYLNVGKL